MQRAPEPPLPCDCSVCVLVTPQPHVLPARLVRKHKELDRLRVLQSTSSKGTNQDRIEKRPLNAEAGTASTSSTSLPKRARLRSSSPAVHGGQYMSLREARERDAGSGSEGDYADIEDMFWDEDDGDERSHRAEDDDMGFDDLEDFGEGGLIDDDGEYGDEADGYSEARSGHGRTSQVPDSPLVSDEADEDSDIPRPRTVIRPATLQALRRKYGIEDDGPDLSDRETDEEQEDERIELDIAHDPMRYGGLDRDEDDEPEEPDPGDRDEVGPGELPRAWAEDERIRYVYILAYIMHTYDHVTDKAIAQYLQTQKVLLNATCPDLRGQPLDDMALGRRAMQARLGVQPDQHITFWVLCSQCWRRHGVVSDLDDLPSPACSREGCNGIVYEIVKRSEGRTKRIAVKVAPYASLEKYILRMLRRPGKYDAMRTHLQRPEDHDDDDDPVQLAPLVSPPEPIDAFPSRSAPLRDIRDGYGIRTLAAGLRRREVSGEQSRWRVRDELAEGAQHSRRFISLPCGLVMIINIDWFQPMKKSRNKVHSTGAIYVTFVNNAELIRFLPSEMHLAMVLPGPTEPSPEQLNEVISLLVDEFIRLYNGIEARVPGYEVKQPVNGMLYMNTSDLPASRKVTGLRGHSSDVFMCTWCDTPMSSLSHDRCFDLERLTKRVDWRFLKYAYRYRTAEDDEQRTEIWEKRGARWSELNRIPGWFPALNSPYDLMHGGFLAVTKHMVRTVLIKGGLLLGAGAMDRFNATLKSVVWPSTIGRIPDKLANISKAAHYKLLALILPVVLYCAIQDDGEIPDIEPPWPRKGSDAEGALLTMQKNYHKMRKKDIVLLHAQGKASLADIERVQDEPPVLDRNIARHYECIHQVCAALRIWSSRSTTPGDVLQAQEQYSLACQSWVQMNCPLTPYFHYLVHATPQILRFGPQPSYWLFGDERANGILSRLRTNGHLGGELEGTLMRGWINSQLVYDLIQELGSKHGGLDRDGLQRLKSRTDEGKKAKDTVHTALANMIQVQTRLNDPAVQPQVGAQVSGTLSTKSRRIELAHMPIYDLVYEFVRDAWQDTLRLVPVGTLTGGRADTEVFGGTNVRSHHYVMARGNKFGAACSTNGRGTSLAYIDGRQPVRIERIVHVRHERRDPTLPDLTISCAIVSPFQAIPGLPPMPWDFLAMESGISVWRAQTTAAQIAIPIHRLIAHFALLTVPLSSQAPFPTAWVTVSLDMFATEPDLEPEGEGNGEEEEGWLDI